MRVEAAGEEAAGPVARPCHSDTRLARLRPYWAWTRSTENSLFCPAAEVPKAKVNLASRVLLGSSSELLLGSDLAQDCSARGVSHASGFPYYRLIAEPLVSESRIG